MLKMMLLLLFAPGTPVLSTPLCERELLVPDTVITVSDSEGRLAITLQSVAGESISCPAVAKNQARLIRRHILELAGERPINTDMLIGFISSPWQSLSNSAGQSLSQALSAKSRSMNEAQLGRLTHLVIANQTSLYTGKMIVRIISKLPGDVAVKALGMILRQSTRLSVQRSAARALGRFPQRAAHTLLKDCVRGDDRMLSSRCERSLVRWAMQHSASPQSPSKRTKRKRRSN